MLRAALLSAILALAPAPAAWSGGMTLGHPYAADSSFDIWARELAGCIEQELGLYIEVFPEGQLGRSSDLAASLANGTIDAAILPAWAFADFWPELAELSKPGYVIDTKAARRLSEGSTLAARMQDEGGWERDLTILGIGWRYDTLVSRDTGSGPPGNLLGLKVRAADAGEAAILEAFGASPWRIELAEVYSAMEVGVVDGAVVDTDIALSMIERGGFSSVAWSEDFTPFASAHVAMMSRASAENFGLDSRVPIAEACGWTALDFTERSIASAQAAVEMAFSSDLSVSNERREAFISYQDGSLDDRVRTAIQDSLR